MSVGAIIMFVFAIIVLFGGSAISIYIAMKK